MIINELLNQLSVTELAPLLCLLLKSTADLQGCWCLAQAG